MALGPVASASALTYLDELHGYMSVLHGQDSHWDSVGAVQIIDPDTGELAGWGSGTLIQSPAGDGLWVLTAAHVVTDAEVIQFSLGDDFDAGIGDTSDGQPVRVYGATSWYVPDSYDGEVISESDIALIRLDPLDPVASTYTRHQISDMYYDEVGSRYRFVGYGTYGNGLEGNIYADGQKRVGRNEFDGTVGINGAIIMHDFDISFFDTYAEEALADFHTIRVPYESESAQGDSGGPQFIGDRIVSITSFGTVGSPFYGTGGDVMVYPWYQWIQDVINDVEGGGDGSGVGSGLFGNGALQGSTGTAITLAFSGFGGDSLSNNQVYYSNLLQNYFDPDFEFTDLSQPLQLLGLMDRDEFISLGDAIDRLQAYDVTLTDGASETEAMLSAMTLLNQAFGALSDKITDLSLNSNTLPSWGFATGLGDPSKLISNDDQIDASEILLGDANLSFLVNITDLTIVADNWLQEDSDENLIDWFQGDFNFDGVVNELDLALLQANYEGDFLSDATSLGLIPEPASLALLGLGLLGVTVRRRR